MLNTKKILLASHDTPGARAAERAAMALCAQGGEIHHLVVVPEFWKGLKGDDWLNNDFTRDQFGEYVENQLEREIRAHAERVHGEVTGKGLRYSVELRQGKPDECLRACVAEGDYDLVVVGMRRPKGAEGYQSTLLTDTVFRGLRTPAVVIPHPDG